MYLSAERLALANQEVRETFEQCSVTWQAIPNWDIGDQGQSRIRSDAVYLNSGKGGGGSVGVGPLGAASIQIDTKQVQFYVTLAQACAPTPDALFAAVMTRTAELAAKLDAFVAYRLRQAVKQDEEELPQTSPQDLLNELIDARVRVENAGYRSPSCLLTNKAGLKALSYLESGYSVLPAILDAANINSLHRVRSFAEEEEPDVEPSANDDDCIEDVDIDEDDDTAIEMVLIGRRQLIAHRGAPSATPGEEPVDLAVSVFPSLEVVGETASGHLELAVRIQFALRIKDVRGLIAVVDEIA